MGRKQGWKTRKCPLCFQKAFFLGFNPLPHMPILGSPDSASNK